MFLRRKHSVKAVLESWFLIGEKRMSHMAKYVVVIQCQIWTSHDITVISVCALKGYVSLISIKFQYVHQKIEKLANIKLTNFVFRNELVFIILHPTKSKTLNITLYILRKCNLMQM